MEILGANAQLINKNDIFDTNGGGKVPIKVPIYVTLQQRTLCECYMENIIINNDEFLGNKYDQYRTGGKVNLELIIPPYIK